jgi:hypothetical protein
MGHCDARPSNIVFCLFTKRQNYVFFCLEVFNAFLTKLNVMTGEFKSVAVLQVFESVLLKLTKLG